MNFLNIKDKTFLITGVSNKKSVAFAVAKTLEEYGANILFTVQNNAQMSTINKFFPDHLALICDVEDEDNIKEVAQELEAKNIKLDVPKGLYEQ